MPPKHRLGKWFEIGSVARNLTTSYRCRIDISEGYDCRTECVHEKKGEHGCHGDEWRFILGTETLALSLICYTNMLHSKKVFHIERGPIWGAWVTLHDGRKKDEPKNDCDILAQGCVCGGTSALLSETLIDPFKRIVEPYLHHPILEITDETVKELGMKLEKLWPAMAHLMWHWVGN